MAHGQGAAVPGRIRIRATWDYQARRICPGAALRPTAKGERRAGHRTRWRDGQDSNLWPRLCRPSLFRCATIPCARHPPGGKRGKKESHFPARAGRVVGQAGIEPTISNVNTRMGDHTPLSHIISGIPEGGAGLPRYAPASGISDHKNRREDLNPSMSRIGCLISADSAPTPSGRGIYACRLSGCQASLPSALPPRSHPAGVPVSPGSHRLRGNPLRSRSVHPRLPPQVSQVAARLSTNTARFPYRAAHPCGAAVPNRPEGRLLHKCSRSGCNAAQMQRIRIGCCGRQGFLDHLGILA